MRTVVIIDKVEKKLRRLPKHVARKLDKWGRDVEQLGIEQVRRIPGYHDEPLLGTRKGQRSIRLNKSYRLIYREYVENTIKVISIEEVSKHEY